jgi:uncharacterized repeat protein (TIGR01451 family)
MLTTKMMWMTRALLVLGVVGATPALGQPVETPRAELVLSTIGSSDETFTFDSPITFTIKMKNYGPSRATGVVVTVTRPNAGETWPTADGVPAIPKTSITGFTGCTRIGVTDSCTIGTIPDFTPGVDPTEVVVTFDVVLNLPPLMPESCPSPSLLGGMGLSVDVDGDTFCEVCPVSRTLSADTFQVAPYAKLDTRVAGPASSSQGQAITFTASVKNLGPCAAPNAIFTIDTADGYLLDQVIKGPDCLTISQADGTCEFGPILPNATKALAVDYTVGALNPAVNYYSTGQSFGGTATSDILDPGSNMSAVTTTVVTNTPGGCDSAGGGGLVGMLGLLAFAIRRRFT